MSALTAEERKQLCALLEKMLMDLEDRLEDYQMLGGRAGAERPPNSLPGSHRAVAAVAIWRRLGSEGLIVRWASYLEAVCGRPPWYRSTKSGRASCREKVC